MSDNGRTAAVSVFVCVLGGGVGAEGEEKTEEAGLGIKTTASSSYNLSHSPLCFSGHPCAAPHIFLTASTICL